MQFSTHKCLQTYQSLLFVSINILFVAHILLLPTPAPQHDDQRMLNLAANTLGVEEVVNINVEHAFLIGNSKSGEISSYIQLLYVQYSFCRTWIFLVLSRDVGLVLKAAA